MKGEIEMDLKYWAHREALMNGKEHRERIGYMMFLKNIISTFKMQLSRPAIVDKHNRKDKLDLMLAIAEDALFEEETHYEN